ncbi:glycine receptor subunit alpha-1-like [Petromyzon marinus]|uniref:glycine receptor subunit alpha-1-like n=1 Tax=Petromyzon marinus TaxID=7757 RepID=UPI003F72FA33
MAMVEPQGFHHKGYDYRIRPSFNEGPVVVNCSIFVEHFSSVEETTMDYEVTIFVRQQWSDRRLSNHSEQETVDLDYPSMATVWRPDLFFANEKSGRFHTITTENRMMRLYRNGDIFHSIRLTLTLSCPMDLRNFPMDTQACYIFLESYGYTTADLLFQWLPAHAVELADDLSLPQFTLSSDIKLSTCNKYYVKGNYSCIGARFLLRREMGFYLIQLYTPSVLIVIISWMSFWIDMSLTPARVGLGITTVLTMTTQSTGSRSSMPKLSYINAMDVWMTACLIFVFAALFEFVLVIMTSGTFSIFNQHAPPSYQVHPPRDQNHRLHHRRRMKSGVSDTEGRAGEEPSCEEAMRRARAIDKGSRLLFPIAFMLFNTIYWVVYLAVISP